MKRGSSPAEILDGVKALIGVEKEDSPYAPQLVTWLNQERWKDGTGKTMLTAAERDANEQRLAESKRPHEVEMRKLVEAKSAELRGAV